MCAGPNPDLPTIVAALKARQNALRTAEFRWTTTRTDKKGSIKAGALVGMADDKVFPPEDTTYSAVEAVLAAVNEKNLRYEFEGKYWDFPDGTLVPYRTRVARSGGSARSFSEAFASKKSQQGVLLDPDQMDFLRVVQTLPVRLYLWPAAPEMGGINDSEVSVLSHDQSPDGHDLVTLQERGPRATRELIVDCALGYSPISLVIRTATGRPTTQYDISCARDTVGRWWPKRWTVATFDKAGIPKTLFTCVVTKSEVNLDVPADAFEIVFPEGTRVIDNTAPEGMTTVYVAGKGGELTSQVEAERDSTSRLRVTLLVINGIVVAFLAWLLLWRTWRRARA